MAREKLKTCPCCGGRMTTGDCSHTGWTAWCIGHKGQSSGCGVQIHHPAYATSRHVIVKWSNRRAPEMEEP